MKGRRKHKPHRLAQHVAIAAPDVNMVRPHWLKTTNWFSATTVLSNYLVDSFTASSRPPLKTMEFPYVLSLPILA